MNMRLLLPLFLAIFTVFIISPAWAADCTAPVRAEGEIIYNADFHIPQYCNGTNWIAMGAIAPAAGGSDPVYQGVTAATQNGQWWSPYGKKRGNQLCKIDYPGSRVMTDDDIKIPSVRDAITNTTSAWIVCGNLAGSTGRSTCQ